MFKTITIPALFLLTAGVAKAEVWVVTEGTNAPARGTWQIASNGGDLSGSADMINAKGQHVTFKLSGTLRNDQYSLQRISPSDGSVCVYRGAMKEPGKIAGSAICGLTSTAWNVTRQQ